MAVTEGAAAMYAAGIAAAGSMGSAAVTSGRGHKSQKRALRYNKELAKYQYDLNMQAWREQNEYNSPAAQMARYQEAGLNPRLVYGQGDNGNASPPPEYSGNYVDPEPINDFGIGAAVDKGVSQWLALKQFEEQQKNNIVSREKIELEGLTEVMRQMQYGQDYDKNSWEYRELRRLGMSQAAVMYNNIQKTQQDIRESSQRVLNLSQEYELSKVMDPIKVDIANAELAKLKETNDWNSFEYAMRKRLNLLPGSSPWDRLLDLALDFIEDPENSKLMKIIGQIRNLMSKKKDIPRDLYQQLSDSIVNPTKKPIGGY